MPRKHLIAASTNKKQQDNARVWQRLAREIKAAAKVGGPNPDANPRLRTAIAKGLANNLSRDSIMKNIATARDSAAMEDMTFEGFGPSGSAFIISALSDNATRTASAVRGYFSKLGGAMVKPGTAQAMFIRQAVFQLKPGASSEERLLDLLQECQVEEITSDQEGIEIVAAPDDYYRISDIFAANGLAAEGGLHYLPLQAVQVLAEETLRLQRFLKQCEDDDDIQGVAHNTALM